MSEVLIGKLVIAGLKFLSKKTTNTVDDKVIEIVETAIPLINLKK